MANTTELKKINDYVINKISDEIGVRLSKRKIKIGTGARTKEFDGVSQDGKIVVFVANHGGMTSGGKKPSGKIKDTFASCFFLTLTKAEKKILVLTNPEFYEIFKKDSEGLLGDIELRYFELPPELVEVLNRVSGQASKEMTRT